jgi:hypothetical protein
LNGKAGLLCALARAGNIPARLSFADVRNHLATRQAWQAFYGAERVRRWAELYDASGGRPVRDFGTEDVVGDTT